MSKPKILEIQGTLLYEGGTNGHVALSESSGNFKYIEIFYKWGNYKLGDVKIDNPNGSIFDLNRIGSTAVYYKRYTINAGTLTDQGLTEINITTGSHATHQPGNGELMIYKVIGYR